MNTPLSLESNVRCATRPMVVLIGIALFLGSVVFTVPRCEGALAAPYTPDASTLHLWHLDEPPGSDAADAVGGAIPLTIVSPGSLGHPSFAGFGTALTTTNNGYASGGVQPLSQFTGADGAFTFEAIIRPDANPLAPPQQMNLVCGERAGSDPRSWQFRINTLGELHFITLNSSGGVIHYAARLPSSGPNAAAPGQWYHVAATYNGQDNTADNLKLFWTLLDSNRTEAALLHATNMVSDLGGEPLLTVGTSGRNPAGEAFRGTIDEIRISSVARAPDEMAFSAGGPPTPPAFTVEPRDEFVGAGETLVLQSIASGSLPLSYQWQFNGTDLLDQTTDTLTISNVTADAAGDYRVRVGNAYGSVTSRVARVVVGALFSEVFATGVANDRSLLEGAAVDPHYVLYESPDPAVPGPGTIVFIDSAAPFPSAALNGPDSKFIGPVVNPTAAAAGGYVYRTEILLDTVDPATGFLEGRWSSDNRGLAIRLNGIDTGISNPNDEAFRGFASFTITNGFVPGPNTLEFVISNTTASITALRVELRGLGLPLPPAAPQILNQPTNRVFVETDTAVLRIVAVGSPPMTYQWFSQAGALPGETRHALRFPGVIAAQAGSYFVVVSNRLGSVTSQVATLTVKANDPPTAGTDKLTASVEPGATLVFPEEVLFENDLDPDGHRLRFTTNSVTSSLDGIVTRTNGMIIFTPSITVFPGDVDTFTYEVRDGFGGTATGTVEVQLVTGAVPAFGHLELAPVAGGYRLRYLRLGDVNYELQRAPDVTGPWSTLSTESPPYGLIDFTDTTPLPDRGFYRVVKP